LKKARSWLNFHPKQENKTPLMVRDFGVLVGAHVDDAGIALESSGGLLLLSVIIMSLSIISTLIFACGDDNSGEPPKKKRGRW
jgi:hypothetical protein